MKKQGILIIGILLILIFGNVLISAICCEKLKEDGLWCQSATVQTACDSEYHIWSDRQTCDSVIECEGTCVNENTGECGEYVAKTQCEESNGVWYEEELDEIPVCQMGCCLIGEDAYFVNNVECKDLFTKYNVEGVFREDITSREGCAAMQTSVKTGACVISTPTEKACRITTNLDCTNDRITELSGYLEDVPAAENIMIRFYEGILCTASVGGNGISNCAKSENTECKDNKVYYKDTCGNFANIYDSSKYQNPDYWTYIKDENDATEVCTVSSSGSNSCGNCDTSDNTVCRNYQDADLGRPQNNLGGLVCGDLSCRYKGRTYQHGESWCEGSAGTFVINQDVTTGEIIESNRTALEDGYNKYNLPGSRYYKLICSFGEVLVEECSDYRNQVCVQGENENGFALSSCIANTWRMCLQITTKTECENPENNLLCKWIPGYAWDYTYMAPENERKEKQGSCVPLVAPGYDFWNGDSQGNILCAIGGVQENTLFETTIWKDRDSMNSWSTKDLSHQCIDKCYALPDYAEEFNQKPGEEKEYPEDIWCPAAGPAVCSEYDRITEYYDESEHQLDSNIEDYHLSDRRGQYCHKEGDELHWLTGGVTGKAYDCTPGAGDEDKDEEKERDYPIYLTNDEWVRSITERVRSLGDCGYKQSISGVYSDPRTEMITAIFQKQAQDGSVKKNITVEQIMFEGGKYLTGDLERYETVLPYETEVYTCGAEGFEGGTCISTANNPDPCPNEVNTGATCPQNAVCCVFTVLD